MKEFICTTCLNVGSPKRLKRGSSGLEKLCWAIFPLGLPYTLWRMFSKYNACRNCADGRMVSIDTPQGQRLLEKFDKGVLGYNSVKAIPEEVKMAWKSDGINKNSLNKPSSPESW